VLRVLIAGGGTGGHLNLGLAVAEALEANVGEVEARFVACRPETDPPILEREGRNFDLFPVLAPPRRPNLQLVRSLRSLGRAVCQTRRLIKDFRPQVMIATGAYGSAAPTLAAWLSSVPVMLLEPEIEPGLATRLLGRLSAAIACAHPQTLARVPTSRARLTGMPLRRAFIMADRQRARAALGLGPGVRYIVCTGGSQGARSLNRALWDALPLLFRKLPGVMVCHTTGAAGYAEGLAQRALLPVEQQQRYRMVESLRSEEMAEALAAADVVVARCGANTIAELRALNVPAVLVPYPFATDEHQKKNAQLLLESGQGLMLEDAELSGETLFEHLVTVLREPGGERQTRQEEARAANARVAHLIHELSGSAGA